MEQKMESQMRIKAYLNIQELFSIHPNGKQQERSLFFFAQNSIFLCPSNSWVRQRYPTKIITECKSSAGVEQFKRRIIWAKPLQLPKWLIFLKEIGSCWRVPWINNDLVTNVGGIFDKVQTVERKTFSPLVTVLNFTNTFGKEKLHFEVRFDKKMFFFANHYQKWRFFHNGLRTERIIRKKETWKT